MAIVDTAENELDRKLHRIVLQAAGGTYASLLDLARSLHELDCVDFSYTRNNEVRYAGISTIKKYASFARALNLLDDHLKPAQEPGVYTSLANFQNWLGNKVMQYLNDNSCSIAKIKDAIRSLLHSPDKSTLPTPDHLLEQLGSPISRELFQYSLRILSIFRSGLLELRSRRLVLSKEVVIS